MIKTLRQAVLQEKERFRIPRSVQHLIPAERIWPDGIFLCGRKYTMMYRFTDINYAVAGKEDKKAMKKEFTFARTHLKNIGRVVRHEELLQPITSEDAGRMSGAERTLKGIEEKFSAMEKKTGEALDKLSAFKEQLGELDKNKTSVKGALRKMKQDKINVMRGQKEKSRE